MGYTKGSYKMGVGELTDSQTMYGYIKGTYRYIKGGYWGT